MEIRDESGDRNNFTMVPNFVYRLGMSAYAVALYGYIKQAAGEKGRCFKATDTISKDLQIGAATVSRAKHELELNGLIRINEVPSGRGKPYHSIAILDVWQRNAEHINSHKADSTEEHESSHQELISSPVEIIKNPLIKNPLQDGDEQKTLVIPSQEYLPESQPAPKAQEPVDTCGIDFPTPAPREQLTTEARIQRLAGAMDAAMSRQGTAAEVAAAIADPRADKRAFVKRFAPLVGAIFCRDAIGEDRAVAGDVWAFHCEPEWLAGRLTAYANGDGDEFRQPTRDGKKPTAYWVRARIEREWAEHKGQLHDTRQREQSRAEYERECREAIEAAERGTLFQGWKPDPPPASVYLHGADAGTLRDAAGDNMGDEGIAVVAARELRVQPDGLAMRPVPRGKVDCYSRGRVPKMQRQGRAVPGLRDDQRPGSSVSAVDAGIHPRQPAPGRDAASTD